MMHHHFLHGAATSLLLFRSINVVVTAQVVSTPTGPTSLSTTNLPSDFPSNAPMLQPENTNEPIVYPNDTVVTTTTTNSSSHVPSSSPSNPLLRTGSSFPSLSPTVPIMTGPSISPNHRSGEEEIPITPDIVGGGTIAEFGKYPFYVVAGPNANALCGGTLIHEDIVMSAAHCKCTTFEGDSGPFYIGGTFRNGSDALDEVYADDCIEHPAYDKVKQYNDIMLLRLTSPSSAPLVSLNFNAVIPKENDVVTVIGYGRTDPDNNQSSTSDLREIDGNAVADATCDDIYVFTGRPLEEGDIDPDYDPKLNVCAGTESGFSCRGDSGGPLLTEQNVQVGIVSYGSSCGSTGVPTSFTEVAAYEKWIKAYICEKSANPPPQDSGCIRVVPTSPPTPDPTYDNPTPAPYDDNDDCITYGMGKGRRMGGGMKCMEGKMGKKSEKMGKKTPKEPKTPKVGKKEKGNKKEMGQKSDGKKRTVRK